MSPLLHHARVYAEWALRRPLVLLLGVLFTLVGTGVGIALEQPEVFEEGWLEMTVLLAVIVGVFGVIAGSLSGPDLGTSDGSGGGRRHPALPLSPGLRTWAEVVGSLAVWVPVSGALALLGQALADPTTSPLASVVHTGSVLLTAHLLPSTALLLPALVAGRRTTTMGSGGAFGPMVLGTALTIPVVLAMQVWAPLGLVVAVLCGGVADRQAGASERVIERGAVASIFRPELPSTDGPWHAGAWRLAWTAWRVTLPMIAFAALGLGLLELIGTTDVSPGRQAWWLIPAAVLVVAPVFMPLGLDARTSSPDGTTRPFQGGFRKAWALLPVEPVTIRRAALRQTAVGTAAIALLASLLLAVGTLGSLDLSSWTLVVLTLGGLAAAPLTTAATLGDARQRQGAITIAVLLVGSLYGGILGGFVFDGAGPVFAAVTVGALTGSALLVRSLLRPCRDEVAGAHVA